MSEATRPEYAGSIATQAKIVLERIGIGRNPYFVALADGSMSRTCFQLTQEQFFFAVTFFPRPMAALIGRIDDPHARLDILHNLLEEHGEFEVRAFHHNTFRELLRRLGSNVDALDTTALWPELRAFNSVLTSACVLDELEVGIACMGIIEHAFANISAAIGRGLVERGWLPADQVIHYTLHAAIDERHAEEFFTVIDRSWRDPGRQYYVMQGLELGAYVFDRLYRDLHERGTLLTSMETVARTVGVGDRSKAVVVAKSHCD
jgi:pyrroloquinoline-quinone synthase